MRSLSNLVLEVFELIAPRECAACGAEHPTYPPTGDPALCALCALSLEQALHAPRGVRVPYEHDGALARAIRHAKYGSSPITARRLGALLAHELRPVVGNVDVVIPVPLHPRRIAQRGFNQAAEMAKALAKPIDTWSIERVRDTPSQVGMHRLERLANMHGAFAARRSLARRRVLIIDDVVTTGATLREVASAARAAGAAEVACAALALAPLDRSRDV